MKAFSSTKHALTENKYDTLKPQYIPDGFFEYSGFTFFGLKIDDVLKFWYYSGNCAGQTSMASHTDNKSFRMFPAGAIFVIVRDV
jgi:hypothetical protein